MLVCVPYAFMILLAPTIGILIDRLGNNIAITTFSCLLIVIAHTLLLSMNGSHHNPGDGKDPETRAIVPICLIGISLTIFNIVSNASNISLLVEEKAFGTAIGINYAV